jgi:hypothetical protein
MRTGSNRALARALGVSETAVHKSEKAGRIHRAGDGSWDVDRVKAAWGANTDVAQQRPPSRGKRPVPEAPPLVPSSRPCRSRACPPPVA